MTQRRITIDGMFSGTGIRDLDNGGYLDIDDLDLSIGLKERIHGWLMDYERLHLYDYADKEKIESLDKEGILIARAVGSELEGFNVCYYSSAKMEMLSV